MHVYTQGTYNAVAVDTLTGCTTYSDTLTFNDDVDTPLTASIYSPHLTVCTGEHYYPDSTRAGRSTFNPSYQWFKNGVLIPGATASTYATSIAGAYTVSIIAGVCDRDTSAPVTVTIVPPPIASITLSTPAICAGGGLPANTGPGYSYTWHINGVTIPGAFSSTYKATQTGSYYVTISNGDAWLTLTKYSYW